MLDGGSAKLSGSVDPLDDQPAFDLNLQLRNVKLPQVNPWLRQYIKADAEAQPHANVRWDDIDPHSVHGTYGEYLLGKVGPVFPALRDAALKP